MAVRSLARLALAAARHPLARRAPARTLGRILRWQLGARILGRPVLMPFASGTQLVVEPGMTGATGNVYFGLHELSDMAFVAHALRPGDLFVDVGANVGTYTVLAAGVSGAEVIACEPVASTYARLIRNVAINGLEARARCVRTAVSDRVGTVVVTTEHDTMNRIVSEAVGERVPATSLDALLGERAPTIVKIDVEGHEAEVLEGASHCLVHGEVLALVVERSESSRALPSWLTSAFSACAYDPVARTLTPLAAEARGQNSLLVRTSRLREIAERCRAATDIDLGWARI